MLMGLLMKIVALLEFIRLLYSKYELESMNARL